MKNDLLKSAIFAFLLTLVSVACWEIYLRSKGYNAAYDDGVELWAHTRSQVYQPASVATVFIGSSRIKYALDIPTWENITGNKAIQLAIEGNSPLPVLDHLAEDNDFKGRVVIDVTEGLFFTTSPHNLDFPKEHVAYYKDRTPAQRASFSINTVLESGLVLFDRDAFSLNALLDKLPLSKRKGVFAIPNAWPPEFGRITIRRQNIMMDRFLTDSSLQKKVTGNWLFFEKISDEKPATGNKLDSILKTIKASVDKIKRRGGDVLFVRTPSSGWYWPNEQKSFPREKYWDKLLRFTNSKGIHFIDYKELDHFVCPEWSHLNHTQSIEFTKAFIQILQNDKGWNILGNDVSINQHSTY